MARGSYGCVDRGRAAGDGRRAPTGRGSHPHGPERHHGRPAVPACRCSSGCCSAGTTGPRPPGCWPCSAPPTGSTATSPATSTRCPSSARSSTRWPTGCCSSSASAASSIDGSVPALVRRRRARPGGRSSPAATLALAALGRPADRRHLVRQGRHLRPDDRVPAVPRPRTSTLGWADTAEVLAWVTGIPGLVLQLLALALYVPAGPARRSASGRADRASPGRFGHVKAVIMAGGEGTRLRPLTSNAPKPMMPLVNEPMMEHIVELLKHARLRRDRGHGGLHGQPHPHLLRRRLRVRRADGLRHRGDAARHRRLGPQRHGRARRALPRDLRRRAHRHRPRRASSTFHEEQQGAGHHRAGPRSRTRSSSASSSPATTARSSASSRSPRGARCSATPSTPGIFVLEPEIFDYIEADRPVDFSARGVPGAARRRASRSSAPSPRATGRTSARSRPTCRAHKDILDGKVAASTIPGFELGDGVWLGEGAEIHPDATVVGPGGDRRRTAASRPAPASATYTVLGTNVRVRAGADLERVVVHDNAYLGEGVRLRGADRRPVLRPARAASACEEGVGARRRVLRRRARRARPRA